MTRIVALNPTSSPPPPEQLGGRLDRLQGATVGFFSNNKPNAAALLERTAAALQTRFTIRPLLFTKTVPSLEAGDELIGQCAEACDAVVLAAFD